VVVKPELTTFVPGQDPKKYSSMEKRREGKKREERR
jgi:hypothetical protein